MLPVSGINTDTVRSLAEAWKTNGTPRVQNPEEDKEKHLSKPDLDEYIPEKQSEGTEGPKDPDKPSEEKSEKCVGNTDQVDREIEKLKKKQKELKQQINSETDEAKIKDLEKKLAQVERELSQKDNDAYRRQHTKFI